MSDAAESKNQIDNLKGVVYENEDALHQAVAEEYGSAGPAQDLGMTPDHKYRLSGYELDDGRVIGYGYDTKTREVAVHGEYQNITEAKRHARHTYANETRDAFSTRDRARQEAARVERETDIAARREAA